MTVLSERRFSQPDALPPVAFLELEITRVCAAACLHCYSNSGPAGGTGKMMSSDWMRVIQQAGRHPSIEAVQFIGGEPTMHPTFLDLARFALLQGLQVAVFTNLIKVTPDLWELYADDRVHLSTSWYSAAPEQHDLITRRPGSYKATWANLVEARRRGIDVKVGLVEVLDGQNIDGALALLDALGVTNRTLDRVRPVGRAAERGHLPSIDDLCGRCGRGRAAIDTDGRLMPCVLGRHLSAGNVRDTPLGELLASQEWRDMVLSVPAQGSCATCAPADSNDCDPAQ